ncbi:hypothetical protein As57867_013148, partial [Aphanomyces stellatus]
MQTAPQRPRAIYTTSAMPSTMLAPTELLFCAGTSSTMEPKKARAPVSSFPFKKHAHLDCRADGTKAKPTTSPRTEDDVDKLVDVLRQSLHLAQQKVTPFTTTHGSSLKRRVYLSPRERVHNSVLRHNMSVSGMPTTSLKPAPSESFERLPSISKPIITSKVTTDLGDVTPEADESCNAVDETDSTQNPSLMHSMSVDQILSPRASNDNNHMLSSDNDRSKSCTNLDKIRDLPFNGFHIEIEEPEVVDPLPPSPMGPWHTFDDDAAFNS